MKKNTVVRFLLFFTGVPALFAFVILDPTPSLMIINAFAVLVAAGAGMECGNLFGLDMKRRGNIVSAALLGMLPPLSAFLTVILQLEWAVFYGSTALLVIVVMVGTLFTYDRQNLAAFNGLLSSRVMLILYPGFLLSHFILLSGFDHNQFIVIVFLACIFMNDSFAYASGMIFGRRSPHPFFLSPKKTLVGLIVGLCASVTVMGIAYAAYPERFSTPVWGPLGLGLLVGLLAVAGDLIESGLKRSAGVKDSGTIIPGRGGIMDSLDSTLLTAPVFLFGMLLLQ